MTTKSLFIGVVLFVLPACSTLQGDIQSNLTAITRFAQADLQAALDDATKQGDQAAVNCWTVLLALNKTGFNVPEVKGFASALQAKRDLMGGVGVSALSKQINIGCAALFMDEAVTTAKLAGMAGVGIPALPILP
jgi:hypothetical protein